MFCPKCGKQLPENSKFCPHCGCSVVIAAEKAPNEDSPSPPDVQLYKPENAPKQTNSPKKKPSALLVISLSFLSVLLIALLVSFLFPGTDRRESHYQAALDLYNAGEPLEAARLLDATGDYKDSLQLCADYYYEAQAYSLAAGAYQKISHTSYENLYKSALCYYLIGRYPTAQQQFAKLGNYKDAQEFSVKCQIAIIKSAEQNDVVSLGFFEQNNDRSDKEPIEWIVADRNGEKVLLMSKMILTYQPFNKNASISSGALSREERYIPWSDSHIRNYLNGEFYDTAFTYEKEYIVSTSHITTDGNTSGYSTKDKVFLLSSDEFYELSEQLPTGSLLQKQTAYAKALVEYEDCYHACYTRDQQPYSGVFGISSVYSPGVIDRHNTVYFVYASSDLGAIRPCIWVDCSE